MAATQTEGRGSSGKGASGGGGLSLEMKMLLPILLLLAILSLFPFFYIIWMSLNTVSLINGISFDFAGLANWTRMFTDVIVGAAWVRAAIYFVATVGLEMVLGVAIALLVHELVWGKNLVLSLILLPMFMAPVIVGLLGRFLTDSSYGLYAYVLRELGIFERDILGTASSALPAVILMDVWEWTPLIVLIVLAGLASVNQYVIEAAKVDGANYLERLRYIVAPSIAGVVIVALLVRSMDAIRYFDIITVTTNGGPGNTTKIIPIRLYETAFRFFDLGSARVGGLRDDDFFFEPWVGQTGNTLRHPLPRAALDAGADTVDGSCVVQAGGRPTLFDTGLHLQADHATLRGALHRWRPRVLLSEQCAGGRIIDDYSGGPRLPRWLRARKEPLPRQAARGVLDHLHAHGPHSGDRTAALHPVPVRKPA